MPQSSVELQGVTIDNELKFDSAYLQALQISRISASCSFQIERRWRLYKLWRKENINWKFYIWKLQLLSIKYDIFVHINQWTKSRVYKR